MRTLLVVDVQNAFIKPKAKDLPERIRQRIQENPYDHLLFTQFINRKDSNFVKLLNWTKAFDPPDTDIVSALAPYTNDENVFEKSTYSAFKSAKLLEYLRTHGITLIEVCGIESDGCVLATAFEGFDLGYEMVVLRDLMRSTSTLNDATENIIKRNIDRQVKER
jgi:nicotinamidase-related amidase